MRVLAAMAGAPQGGAEAFFERLCVALRRAGVELAVAIRADAARAARLEKRGLAVSQWRFGGPFDFSTGPAFRRLARAFRPDIVLTFMSRASTFCPPGRRAGGGFLHLARLGGYYPLKHYRRADHLIANTEDIADYLKREGWPAERTHYVPNFVRAHLAAPEDRAAHATPAEAPLILALGRLHPNKAFDTLIAALARLPSAYAWIAGAGDLAAALAAQARDAGVAERVRFLGWRDDPAPLFAAADMVCVPSRHEPLGNVVIEAWAQSRAVVAAASAGPRALIAEGVDGTLVPVDDAPALAAALKRLIDNPALAKALGRAGRAAYEARFTEAAVVRQYLDLFQRLLAAEGQP